MSAGMGVEGRGCETGDGISDHLTSGPRNGRPQCRPRCRASGIRIAAGLMILALPSLDASASDIVVNVS
jgi:hypothetical protein